MDEFQDIPQGLKRDLASAYAADPNVPAAVDEAILGKLSRRHRLRFIMRLGSLAAAAAVALLVVHQIVTRQESSPIQLSVAVAREDLNSDGRVDVLDAFYLARQVAQSQPTKPQWDFNGDGNVDRADADAVALAAVSLNRANVQ